MIPSSNFGLNWPIGIEDTTVVRPSNQPSRYGDWQFGLRRVRMAELAAVSAAPNCLTRQWCAASLRYFDGSPCCAAGGAMLRASNNHAVSNISEAPACG